MKKSLIFAACAIAAMTACTKNEVFVSEQQNNSQIGFTAFSATQTKSTLVNGTTLPEETPNGDFTVYGWYQEGIGTDATFDPGKAYTTYMKAVKCQYTENETEPQKKTWMPENVYFWPKNGKLTFSAYYPATAVPTEVTATEGIKYTGYTIADATNQVDLMFSTRTYDKQSSTHPTEYTTDYDGVDLVFNHALAAADFKVKTAADYGTDAIKITKIEILNAYKTADFAEGYTSGKKADNPTATWSNWTNNTSSVYTVLNTELVPTTNVATAGTTCILIPQDFEDATVIKVYYGIKYFDGTTDAYLDQTAEFKLKDTLKNEDGSAIAGWEMGKYYHYNLTFSLDKVYFAPSVTKWEDVIVKDIEVK